MHNARPQSIVQQLTNLRGKEGEKRGAWGKEAPQQNFTYQCQQKLINTNHK